MTLHRSLFAAALAALLALPAGARAQDAGGTQGLSVGGGLGLEFGALDTTGFGLRVDGVYPLMEMSDQLSLSLVGSLGYSRWSDDENTIFGDFSQTVNLFKVVPSARLAFEATPGLSVYGDAGLGVYHARLTVELLGEEETDSETSFLARFAAGAMYSVSPQLQVGAEIGLNPYFGDFDDTSVSAFATILYRL